MTESLRRAKVATGVCFFVSGALFATWASRIPAVKGALHIGTGELGLSLLGMALGAVLAKQVSGALVSRFGPGPIARAGVLLNCLLLSVPAWAQSATELQIALTVLGVSMGLADVAMNAHGIAVQHLVGTSQMSKFHGLYSVGGIVAALTGGGAAGLHLSVRSHFLVVSVALGGLVMVVGRWLLSVTDVAVDDGPEQAGREPGPRGVVMRRLILLGLVVMCGMMCEGASADWSALYLTGNLHVRAVFSSWGYAAFAVAMASSRLSADRLINRWDGLRLVGWSTFLAGGGFGFALLAENAVAAVIGFALLGIGLAAVVPVFYSVAAGVGDASMGQAITVVSSIGGMGYLAGPPALGFVAQLAGLPRTLSIVSLLCFIVAASAWLIRHRRVPEQRPGEIHVPG